MLIRSIGPFITKTSKDTLQRTTNFGGYRDWHFVIDGFRDSSGKIVSKRFVFWNNIVQHIVNKKRNDKKGFDRYW